MANSKWLTRAALVAIVFVTYVNSLGLGLVEDSRVVIGQDPRIRAITIENLKLIFAKDYWWPNPADLIYRPVTTLSFLLNYSVLGSGASPGSYHWINFLLHALNACLVYELARRFVKGHGAAFFAAALWAVHPIATEAVDNIVGRADLLAAAAVLGGLVLYLQGAKPAVLAAVSALGYFTKESAVVLPGLMLLCDIAYSKPVRRRLWNYAAVLAPLALLLIARALIFHALPWPRTVYLDNVLTGVGFWQGRFTAIKVLGHYLWLLLCPIQLASDRSYAEIAPAGWSDVFAWASLVVVALLIASAIARRRRYPLAFWLAGFLGLTLLPTSNLLFLIRSAMAERFLYLPSAAFAIAVTAFLSHRLAPRNANAVLTLLLLLYAGRTWGRNADWESNLTLATADVRTAPHSVRLRDLLAKALFEQNEQHNIDRVIQEQEIAWEILKRLPDAKSSELPPTNLGVYYAVKASLVPALQSRQWYEKSVAVLERARAISEAGEKAFDEAQLAHGKPLGPRQGHALLYLYLANDLMNLGRHAAALEALRYARILKPRMPEVYDGLAAAYQANGQADWAAIALLEKAMVAGAPVDASQHGYDLARTDLAEAFRQARDTIGTFSR